jgi:GT2 family glycosyltransferase
MDSDAIVKTTFVETIIKEFQENDNLVLHMEEIRNFDKKYYPFSYPAIEEILGPGRTMPYKVNIVDDGKAVDLGISLISLKEDWNLMHVYNYGACFCAKREDIIRIGGADEHPDYMGHICGPYEMTFRLINAGLTDKLHTKHFLYHVYHPSQGGDNNYCGPNNGKGMSLTAMEIPASGRVLPLVENSEIRQLRLKL